MTWIGLYEGGSCDFVEPLPEDFEIDDIARGLSRVNRFVGHTHDPYSVAQHCVAVANIVARDHPELALCALLHDASEAYTGDCPRPLKQLLPGFREVEDRLMAAIAERFGFAWPMPPEVKEVDNRLLVTEKALLQPGGPAWETMRDVQPYPNFTIRYQPWDTASALFLRKFYDITEQKPLTGFYEVTQEE